MLTKRSLACSAVAALAWTGVTSAARIAARAVPYTLIAGGYTDVITTLSFDPAGKISVVGTAPSGTNPSWVANHPTLKAVKYSTNEYDAGLVSSFTTASTGIVAKAKDASALGDAPAHLAVVRGGTELLIANYNSGTVGAYTLSPDGLSFIGGQKLGPFPSATNISHPHQVVEYGTEVFIPDLGADKIWRLGKNTISKGWAVTGFIGQPAGSGPRHIVTKGNIVFVLHELSNTLIAQYITYAPTNASNPVTISSVSVLPPLSSVPVAGRFHAAELILSLDGQYLYASNRDTSATPDPRGDAIAIIQISIGGKLTVVKHVFTGLQLLRGLSLSPDGKYLIGGGQAAGGVAAWAIVNGGADLKEVARNSAGPAATGFAWL